MAEQEVIKHTKKIYKVWKGPTSFWHKLKEFLLEIFIIVLPSACRFGSTTVVNIATSRLT